jgi:hypothetical protein
MLFDIQNINVLAVVLAFVINMAVGSLWYSPIILGETWMKLKGLKQQDLQNAGNAMALSAVGGFIAMVVLAYVVSWSQADNLIEGFLIGFIMSLAVHSTTFNQVCFDKEKGFDKRLRLWVVDYGSTVITYIIVAILYALW